MSEDFKDFLISVVIPAVLSLFVLLVVVTLQEAACTERVKGIGEPQWGIVSGCMVKPNGTDFFIPLENYRVI